MTGLHISMTIQMSMKMMILITLGIVEGWHEGGGDPGHCQALVGGHGGVRGD